MKQQSTLDKITNGKSLTDSKVVVWFRDRLYPILMLLTGTKVKFKVEVQNTYNPVPQKPIIFVCNHQSFQDTPLLLRVTKRRSYILAGKQNLASIDQLFFDLIGTIWIDRKNKQDMVASKDGILAKLKDGHSVCWFPEGTWNLTPNQLIMPIKWGIIDIACQAEAQLIPVAFDYNRETMICRAKFGEPIVCSDTEDKARSIVNLRDTMATMRLDLMCLNPTLKRSEIKIEELKAGLFDAITEYPPLNYEYEESCIYRPYEDVEVLPKNIEVCMKNAFLFNKRMK